MSDRWMTSIRGQLTVLLTGYNPERFLNLMKAGGIEVRSLCCKGDSYEFSMDPGDFKRLKPLVKKSGVRIRILKKSGMCFFVRKNRKRFWYPMGCLLFFLLLYSLSFFVWRIDFEGNDKFTDEYLTGYLKEIGVTAGVMKSGISCDELEERIRGDFNEITWVSAQITGTCLSVHIKENEVLLYVPQKDGTPCDLVAEKDGVITRVVVRSGVPMVQAGDEVTRGQILVSGQVPITNDGEEVVSVHQVTADADIYAVTEMNLTRTVPRTYRAEQATGRRRRGFHLNLFGREFAYILPSYGDNIWKTIRRENQLHLTEDFYLPIHWGEVVSREYEVSDRFYSEKQYYAMAEQWMEEELEKLEEKGIQILANDVKIKVSDSSCRMLLGLKLEEEIAAQAAIEQSEETGETDERN